MILAFAALEKIDEAQQHRSDQGYSGLEE